MQFDGLVLPLKNDCSYIVSKTTAWTVEAHLEHVYAQPAQVRFLEIKFPHGLSVLLEHGHVSINGEAMTLPFSNTLFTIESDGKYSIFFNSILGLKIKLTLSLAKIIVDPSQSWNTAIVFNNSFLENLKIL